ncbi:MAG: diguanylate cyclase [Pseudomonadota bacterium]
MMALFARILSVLALLFAPAAWAATAVPVGSDTPVIDLGPFTEMELDQWGNLEISTAPGLDGVTQRIEVRATNPNTRHWAVIGLQNPGDEQLDRLLVAPHHRLPGSGILGPDLGSQRVVAITPSEGFSPTRRDAVDADVYLVTLDPGSTVTYVMELTTPRLPMLRLWEPSAYTASENAYTLFKGVVVGISGLLAVFFLVVFVIKGQTMFASAAVLAWAAFAYVLVDFSFVGDVIARRVGNTASLRAFAEVLLALALFGFVTSYLQMNRWRLRNLYLIAILIPLGIGGAWLAQFNPVLTASIARVALLFTAAYGTFVLLIAAVRGQERALLLLPTWALFIAWIAAAGMTAHGAIDNDFVQPALNGGLILLVLLIGFTVMQHAFANSSIAPNLAKDVERDVLSLAGSGDIVWDWDVTADHIACGADAEHMLGLEKNALQGPPQDWFPVLHPQDRDRFRATLDAAVERRRGRINDLFRFRGVDGHFRWFRLRARPVIGTTGEIIRCVGTMHDLTEEKTIEERLLHDSVYDNLTGLPNRYLFLDRIEMARSWSNPQSATRLFIIVLNPDNFSEINDSYGQSVGDSLLLTIARRLGRALKSHDSLARLSGDSFGLLVYCAPEKLDDYAERIREVLAAPVQFADDELSVQVSMGVAAMDLEAEGPGELLDNAELALRRAKRQGGDRVERFDPLMRRLNMSGRSLARDLKRAIMEDKVRLELRPIQDLQNNVLAGYEAAPTWHHPLQGPLAWAELLELAAGEELAMQLALSTVDRCARQISAMRAKGADVTVLVPLPVGEAFRAELIGDIKSIVARNRLDPGVLQIGVPENLISQNPEFAVQLLARLREVGASPWMTNFARRTSALPHLHRLALDGIRFDEHATAQATREGDRKLILALFAFAKALEAQVMVGGIKDAAEAAVFARLGAAVGTGPAFGRPIAASASSAPLVEQVAAAQ